VSSNINEKELKAKLPKILLRNNFHIINTCFHIINKAQIKMIIIRLGSLYNYKVYTPFLEK